MNQPATITCPPLEVLDHFVANGSRAEDIRNHLQSCRACLEQTERIGQNLNFLRAAPATAPGGADREIRSRVEIEGYEILEEIHRGGQGIVYKAVQKATHRTVAVKLLLHGAFATSRQRRRFEREVELVARLQHPNIVSVIDCGETFDGRHFYAMEYVDGVRLDEWIADCRFRIADCPESRDHATSIRDPKSQIRHTLQLVAEIADAVDYAHQRGVLHRDLKPGNILIDERGRPRLVDFGLGKALDSNPGGTRSLSISEPGAMLGTLGYMAPEQALGDGREISVRSDVYALGVIAYELVSGRLPFAVHGPLDQVLDRIAHAEPPIPSSHRGRADADLTAIVLKALEKNPADRYATAGQFAADIRRYLGNQTIIARRAGWPTRVLRWSRRNRRIVSVAGLAFLIVTINVVYAFVRIRDERDRAREAEAAARVEARHATQASSFLVNMLALFDYDEGGKGPDVSVRDVLDFGVAQMDTVENAKTRARLQHAIGSIYKGLGMYDRAAPLLAAALASRRDDPATEPVELAHTMNLLGGTYHALGDYDDAQRLYEEALGVFREQGEASAGNVAVTLSNLGTLLLYHRANPVAAEPRLMESLAIRRALHPQGHVETAAALRELAAANEKLGRIDDALTLVREAQAMLTDLKKTDGLEFAYLLRDGAWLFVAVGEWKKAEARFAEAAKLIEKLRGRDHPEFAKSLSDWAVAMLCDDQTAEAESCCRRALAIQKATYGTEHPETVKTMSTLAGVLRSSGDITAAEAMGREALAIRLRLLDADHPDTAITRLTLSGILLDVGELEEADSHCREALRIRLACRPPGHPDIRAAERLLTRIRIARSTKPPRMR